jgi:hydroxyacylglutathione hydrolase
MSIEPIHGIGRERSYLITTPKENILIDVGWPTTAHKVLNKSSKISTVVLTHRHYDHHGSVHIIQQNTRAKIIAGLSNGTTIELAPWYITFPTLLSSWIRQGCHIPSLYDIRNIHFSLSHVDTILKEGDYVDRDKQWQVIETPGHTNDSICIFNKHKGILFSGDTIVNTFGKPYFTNLISNKKMMEKTKRKLLRLKVKKIYPGHGDAFDVTESVRENIFGN